MASIVEVGSSSNMNWQAMQSKIIGADHSWVGNRREGRWGMSCGASKKCGEPDDHGDCLDTCLLLFPGLETSLHSPKFISRPILDNGFLFGI